MVSYNQSGYIGISRSHRAKEAYEGGERPASKWTKKALIEAIAEAFGDEVAEKARKVPLEALKDAFLKPSSWHHTGAYATPTTFYSIDDDMTAEEASQLINQLLAEKAEKKPAKKAEKKAVFLKIVAERNTSKYRRWTNWKRFTYFGIGKEGDRFARIIATDSNLLEDKIKIDGIHVMSASKIDSRRQFTKEIKTFLEIAKIGNISKKIDEFLKK